jgi:flagellar motor switch protein FliG
MALLARFRRPGGFAQLLQLIETCEPAKQKNLLGLVSQEDPGWAHLVQTKAITTERVFSWPDHVLQEIIPNIPEKIAVALYVSLSDQQKMRFKTNLSNMRKKALEESLGYASTATASEQNAARVRLIQLVRTLEAEGKIKFQTFDPVLIIDPGIAA